MIAEAGAEVEEAEGFGEVVFDGVVLVDAEGVAVGQAARVVGRDARAGFARAGEGRVGAEGHEVEGAEADGEVNGVAAGADGGDDVAEEAGAVLEGAAVGPGAGEGAEEFVEEVAVAVFDVHEVGADVPSDAGGGRVVFDEAREVAVGPDLVRRS